MFVNLNLPKPSNKLIALSKKLAYDKPINVDALKWNQRLQPEGTNIGPGSWFMDTKLSELFYSQYQHFFKLTVYPYIGVIRNIGTTPACYPAHSDQGRNVGINFYIETGGSNVETVFYDKIDPVEDTVGGYVVSYTDLPPVIDRIVFQTDQWYLLRARQYHSVENIESTRIILSLFYKGNVDEFIEQHQHLIVK